MNPIERVFNAVLTAVFGLVRALFGGMARAPITAVQQQIQGVDIRRATAHELLDLRHRVLRQGRPRDTAHMDGDGHARTRHWIAKNGDDVIGGVSLMQTPWPATEPAPFDPAPQHQLRGMATAPAWRGKGVGAALLAVLEREADAPLWCNARTGARGFYAKHGWVVVGEPFEIPDVGPHVRMVRELTASE
ncbi:MAG: GNAT family N-acetyltransferase [Myxococcota bacterium]